MNQFPNLDPNLLEEEVLYQIGRQSVLETYTNSVVDYINLVSDRDPIENLREDIVKSKRDQTQSTSFYEGIDEAFIDAVIEDLIYSSIDDNEEITELLIEWLYKYIVYNIRDPAVLDLLNFDNFVGDISLNFEELLPVARTHAQIFSRVQSYFSEESADDPIRMNLTNILKNVGTALRATFRDSTGVESDGRLNRLFREYLSSYSIVQRLEPRRSIDTYLPSYELIMNI